MMVAVLKSLFLRDLGKLKTEIELYQDEKNIWCIDKQIANTAGNLCLHLVGNLNAYIGAELIKGIDETARVLSDTFDKLSDEQLAEEYPQNVIDGKVTTGYFLTHLA